MIKNDRQFHIVRARLQRLSRLAGELEQRLGREGPEGRTELELRAVQGERARMEAELEEYEALLSGRVEVGTARAVEDLPRLLVRARIAAGLTQAQLAEELGLAGQQIQRYESTDYEGASLPRLSEIARVLGVRLVPEEATAALPSWYQLARRLESVGLDRALLTQRIAPAAARAGHDDASTILLSVAARLGRIFGWDLREVLSEAPEPSLRPGAADAFDPARLASERRLKTYTAYARYLVVQTLRATPDLKACRVPDSPFLLRSLLEARGGLTLQAAVVCAWDLGIPVLPLSDPGGFQAAYWRHEGRGAVVLNQQHRTQPQWLFDLLHALRYASEFPEQPEREAVDVPPEDPSRRGAPEEERANRFAGEVLLGENPAGLFNLVWEKSAGNVGLLKKAVEFVARRKGVEVAPLACYVAHSLSERGIGWWAAAASLQPHQDDPWVLCRNIYLSRTDLSRLEPLDRDLVLQALADEPTGLALVAGAGTGSGGC